MELTNISHYLATLIGGVVLIIGVGAVVAPRRMSANFGVAASESAVPYVISTGIRDVFIGLTVLILFYFSAWRVLGLINLCIGLVAIFDFGVVQKFGIKKISYVHLSGAIAVVLYGIFLLAN